MALEYSTRPIAIPLSTGMRPGPTNMESQLRLIAATKANIARLTAQIDELHSLRERERSALAELRLTVVPVGQLPPELLAEIFKLAVETPIFPSERGDRWTYAFLDMYTGDARVALRKVLRLSQVCGHWRQLVLNTPQLWTEGVVDVHLTRTLTDRYLDGLKSRLARSTPYPISVSFTGTAVLSHFERMMDTIVLTAPRWKNLQINMEAFPFHDITRGTFQTLERLYIRDCRGQMNTVTAFQSCPRLRDVTLRLAYSKIHLIQVPWWQLTHLDIVDESLGGCRAALLQCSNLIRAAITTSDEWDLAPGAVDSPVVVLPLLETLIMNFDGDGDGDPDIDGIAAFFRPLSLPSLKEIDLTFHPEVEEIWPTTVFSEFQSRSPELKAIALRFSAINSAGLIALLRHGPSLETFTIRNSWFCVDNDFFEALTYDKSDPAPVAPQLQNIELDCVGDEFQEALLETAIRSRCWKDDEGSGSRVSRLKQVRLLPADNESLPSVALRARMSKELVAQGLDIYLGEY